MTQANTLTGSTGATTSGLLTATGAETVYDTTVAISFEINGKAYSKATVADGVTPLTDGNAAALATMAADEGSVVTWALNAAGTVGIFQSSVEALSASDGSFKVTPAYAAVDLTTWCPFAYQILKNGSTGRPFTIGTSNWDATGMTVTIVNVHHMPDRPQES